MSEHEEGTTLSELSVVGVRVELPSQQPIVLLKEVDGDRYLPIWIGAVEATAIAFAQQGVVTARPMTHDLLRDLLGAFDRPLLTVTITELREGVFHASLGFAGGLQVSARPSDAIALALRTGAVIKGEEAVLVEAGIAIPDEQEDEVEKFREFLDQINPEDFEPLNPPSTVARSVDLEGSLTVRTRRSGSLTTSAALPTVRVDLHSGGGRLMPATPDSQRWFTLAVRVELTSQDADSVLVREVAGVPQEQGPPDHLRPDPTPAGPGLPIMAYGRDPHVRQASLFDHLPVEQRPGATAEDVGYRGATACAAAGITYRQLDYWARTGLVEPSVQEAAGSGSQRLYGFRDILVLKIVKKLLDAGVSLQNIRNAIATLRDQGVEELEQITLVSDGTTVYECSSTDDVFDLLQGGQAVFAIAVGRQVRDVEGSLAHLPVERGRDLEAAADELANRRRRRTAG